MINYQRKGDDIYIYDQENFDAEKIALSGQIFRYFQEDDGYTILSGQYKCRCIVQKTEKFVKLNTNNSEYFINYFDLNKNYDIINNEYSERSFVKSAVEYSKGIRLLKQDRFETVISFIISANNNIPRIKLIIERLCQAAGRRYGEYTAFPTADEMKDLTEDFYTKIGSGYRAPYLLKTVTAINDGFDLDAVDRMDTESAHKYLMTLYGIGPKVADCVLLFAYGRGDVFPVDTWIKKSAREYFGIPHNDIKKIRKELIDIFGNDSGIIQQYIYFYIRNMPRHTQND
ncbi:MAG: hypothetical protein LBT30_04590 [Clostridiales bacterium]|jgi:N-glycosylase/DNA lyase|nr:hypothetical protein [Clostridiales bacterium]